MHPTHAQSGVRSQTCHSAVARDSAAHRAVLRSSLVLHPCAIREKKMKNTLSKHFPMISSSVIIVLMQRSLTETVKEATSVATDGPQWLPFRQAGRLQQRHECRRPKTTRNSGIKPFERADVSPAARFPPAWDDVP